MNFMQRRAAKLAFPQTVAMMEARKRFADLCLAEKPVDAPTLSNIANKFNEERAKLLAVVKAREGNCMKTPARLVFGGALITLAAKIPEIKCGISGKITENDLIAAGIAIGAGLAAMTVGAVLIPLKKLHERRFAASMKTAEENLLNEIAKMRPGYVAAGGKAKI